MRKFLLVLVGFIGLVMLLAITLPYLFRDTLKARMLAEIDRKINAVCTFSDLGVSSFHNFPHMTLNIRDFCLTGKEDFAGDTLAYAQLVSISFDYADLFRGKEINIRRVRLVQPAVHLRTLSNGDVNYKIGATDTVSAGSSRFNININRWEIENGEFSMYDRPQRSYLEMTGINHSGNGDFTQDVSDMTITTSVEAISYSFNGINFLDRKKLSTNMVMEMNLKEHKFTFKDHVFEINHFKFGFEGYLKFPEKGYEVDVRLLVNQTDFRNFLSLMPGFYVDDFKKMTVSGQFALDGHFKGVYDFATNQIPTFALDLKVRNGMYKYEHLPKAAENINLDFIMFNDTGNPDNTTFDIRDFRFDVDHKPVSGKLKVTGMKNPLIQSEIKVDVDLAELEKMHPITGTTLKGNLWADIKVDGQYDRDNNRFPLIDAHLKIDSGFLKSNGYVPMEKVQLDAEAINRTGKMEDTKIDLHSMSYRIDDEPFTMKGSISNLADYRYSLDIDGVLDLGKISRLYPVRGLEVTGTMDVDVETSGSIADLETKNYKGLNATGSIEIKDVVINDEEFSKIIRLPSGKLQFNPDHVVLQKLSILYDKSNLAVEGHLFDYMPMLLGTSQLIRGDLEVQCDTLDLNSISASRSAVTDTAQNKPQIIEIPKWLNFQIDASIGFLRFDQMDIEGLEGDVKIKNGILSLNETGFTSKNARFAISGDYNTTDIKHPQFDMIIDIDSLDINKAFEMFQTVQTAAPLAENTDGIFSTKYHLKGELAPDFTPVLATLTGNGTIVIDDAMIKGTKVFNHVGKITSKDELADPHVQDIIMETEIKGGKVFIKPFSFQLGKYHTEFEGSHSFDNVMDYVLRISVPPFNKIKIPFHISGTVDKPVVKLGKGHEKFDFTTF